MKARVKATGEIVEINESSTIYDAGLRHVYNASELENVPDTDPDYWTRLEHQAAIAAMQGMIADPALIDVYSADGKLSFQPFVEATADICYDFAHALVEKLKEKEERK